MSVSRRIWIIAMLVAVLLPATTQDVTAADQALYVSFHPGPQRITVTLANGTPVGTTSGAPTVIAPGLYTVSMDDSAGAVGPEFDLRGPGVRLLENMFYGEIQAATFSATF